MFNFGHTATNPISATKLALASWPKELNFVFSPEVPSAHCSLGATFIMACCLTVASLSASASVVTFTGEDLNAGPGSAHPNSTAAANNFYSAASALGTVSNITFESAPTGSFTSLTVAPGVTISGTSYVGASQQILNSPAYPSAPSLDGFNTTAGGTQYVELQGGSLVFNFANATQFFGAYLTGVQTSFYQDIDHFF